MEPYKWTEQKRFIAAHLLIRSVEETKQPGAWFTNDVVRATILIEEQLNRKGSLFTRRNGNFTLFGTTISILPLRLAGAAFWHCTVVILENIDQADPVAVSEARMVPSILKGYSPLILEI